MIEIFKDKKKRKDLLKRVGKTFGQAFVGAITVEGIVITDFNALKTTLTSLVIAGISAGICAVWNMLIAQFGKEA